MEAYLDMLLEILGTLEGLAAALARMRLERNVDANVRGHVIALDGGGPAGVPLAGEVQVFCTLAPNMVFTDVLLERRVSD